MNSLFGMKEKAEEEWVQNDEIQACTTATDLVTTERSLEI